MGPYRPVWAHMGSARALEERDKFRKTPLFVRDTFFLKVLVFHLHMSSRIFESFAANFVLFPSPKYMYYVLFFLRY